MVEIVKEKLCCKKQSLNKGFLEIPQEVKILDDDLILYIVDNMKESDKENNITDMSIKSEWDFLYW